MICKHCYVIPKSLTKTLSNLRELERKLRFLLYSGLLLFKGNGGRERERVKGGRGQEQGNGDEDVGNGNGGGQGRGEQRRVERERRRNGDGGTGTGERRRKERERERKREKQEEGGRGNWNGIQGSSRQKRIKLKEQHNNKQNNFRTHSIISGIKRSFFHQLNKTKI